MLRDLRRASVAPPVASTPRTTRRKSSLHQLAFRVGTTDVFLETDIAHENFQAAVT